MNKPACGQSPALIGNIADMKKEIAAMKASAQANARAASKSLEAIRQSWDLISRIRGDHYL